MGLQIITSGETSGGYANGVSSGRLDNWTDVGMSGSHTATFYWYDRGREGDNGESRVDLTVRNDWTATNNDDRSMTVTVTSTIVSMTRTVTTNFTNCHDSDTFYYRRLRFWLNGQWLVGLYRDCSEGICSTHNVLTDYQLGRTTITVPPESESSGQQGFFIRNDTCGWSQWYDAADINYDVQAHGWYADAISGSIRFRNTNPKIPPPPVVSLTCGAVANTTNGKVTASYTGEEVSSFTVELADDPDFTNVIHTGSGEWALNSNTTYYVRATAVNTGGTTTETCQFTTLAASAIVSHKFYTEHNTILIITVDNGGDACDVSSQIFVREKGAEEWSSAGTTDKINSSNFSVVDLVDYAKTYEAKIVTTNCAGAYTSAIYEFTTPEQESLSGVIDSVNSKLEATEQSVIVDYCYTITNEIESEAKFTLLHRLEYRVRGEESWETTDVITVPDFSDETLTYCGQIEGLACGTVYEFRSWQAAEELGIESNSPIQEYRTAECGDTFNCICDNLFYMTELICQELNLIKNGEKTIYANCPTKKLCDPYSMNPTLESILSRLLRFAQAVNCILCDRGRINLSSGHDGDVYVGTTNGQYGIWQQTASEIVEGAQEIASSGAVKQAISKYINSTWHSVGAYDYFAEDLDGLAVEAPTPTSNQTAVVGLAVYKYVNGEWSKDDELSAVIVAGDPFGVASITGGETHAHSEWYLFNGKWNQLDFNSEETLSDLESIEEDIDKGIVQNYGKGPTGDLFEKVNIMVVDSEDSDEEIIARADSATPVVVFVTRGQFVDSPAIVDSSALDEGKELI